MCPGTIRICFRYAVVDMKCRLSQQTEPDVTVETNNFIQYCDCEAENVGFSYSSSSTQEVILVCQLQLHIPNNHFFQKTIWYIRVVHFESTILNRSNNRLGLDKIGVRDIWALWDAFPVDWCIIKDSHGSHHWSCGSSEKFRWLVTGYMHQINPSEVLSSQCSLAFPQETSPFQTIEANAVRILNTQIWRTRFSLLSNSCTMSFDRTSQTPR